MASSASSVPIAQTEPRSDLLSAVARIAPPLASPVASRTARTSVLQSGNPFHGASQTPPRVASNRSTTRAADFDPFSSFQTEQQQSASDSDDGFEFAPEAAPSKSLPAQSETRQAITAAPRASKSACFPIRAMFCSAQILCVFVQKRRRTRQRVHRKTRTSHQISHRMLS